MKILTILLIGIAVMGAVSTIIVPIIHHLNRDILEFMVDATVGYIIGYFLGKLLVKIFGDINL